MTIQNALSQFYNKNNLPVDGGKNEDFFYLKFLSFSIKLPNPKFRKKVIHIHDIQHVLFNCDITWKGEAFIAGWEIATGMWKHFPIGFMSLSAMGFSLFIYPRKVFKGYFTGIKNHSLLSLNLPENELNKMQSSTLLKMITKEKPVPITISQYLFFLFWCLLCIVIFLFPLIILIVIYSFI